jgi:hypothetical protein
MATIFKPDGSLTDEYQQMSATIPWRDIENRFTQITTGALNPDTGKAWVDQAEKDAYIEKHTTETYNAVIKNEYAPVTDESKTASAIAELTAIFEKGTKTDAEYKTALLGATDAQWKSMATNTPAEYDIALDWAIRNGVVSQTSVPQGVNTIGELRDWLGNLESVLGNDTNWELMGNGYGLKISYPSGKGPIIQVDGELYRLVDARNWLFDDGTPTGIGTDWWRATSVLVENVMTGQSKYLVDETHDIDG